MGVFSKFAAALVAIPSPVLGGMTTFLFSAVAVSGIRIISTVPFTRRNRFILTAAMSIGFGATLVPKWFSYVFTYSGSNTGLQGFFNAIILVMETGFAVTAFLALTLNLLLPEETEVEAVDNTANVTGEGDDQKEWERIRRPSVIRAARKSAELDEARHASVSVNEQHDVEKMVTIKES
jgi:NCS2 family nucleobase:cation symporter-2